MAYDEGLVRSKSAVAHSGKVSVHSLQMIVLDKQGCLVRSYPSLILKNSSIIQDLQTLLKE